MILDRLENAALYYGLNQRLATALRALQDRALLQAAPGRHDLQGAEVFALVQCYDTKPRDLGKWEAHRRYLDVQCVVAGAEVMGQAALADLTVAEPYSEQKDMIFLTGQGNFFTVSAGTFAVFFPHDAHMPGLAVRTPAPVHKIVIKVRA